MHAKELRELYAAPPFRPFEIVLTNGTRVVVDHPEFMSFSRDYRTAHVYDVDGSGKRVDVKRIIALNELKNGSRPRKRKQ